MQALSTLPHAFLVLDESASVSAKVDQDFTFKLKINHDDENFEQEEKEEQEFSFACANPQESVITAYEIFDNCQIRPIFPVFGGASPLRPPLKKLFVEQQQHDVFTSGSKPQGAPEGALRELSHKMTMLEVEVKDSKEMCKKSNSTGFSKLWRLRRNLKLRSNSDGKDAFVFLKPPAPVKLEKSCEAKMKNDVVRNGKVGKRKTVPSSSAHEKVYVMNRKRMESDKRRSFLPYRQQLVGFFANVNGFSRNLHPF